MGFVEDILSSIFGRVKSDLTYKAGSEISTGVEKAVKGRLDKGSGGPKKLEKCPKCNAKITEPDLKFCPACGAKLVASCEKCVRDFLYGTKFCTQCGGKLK